MPPIWQKFKEFFAVAAALPSEACKKSNLIELKSSRKRLKNDAAVKIA